MTYAIVVPREFYGPSETRALVMSESGQRAMTFIDRRGAAAYIADLESQRYYLAHNESSRPSYAIRPVHSLPAYLAQQV